MRKCPAINLKSNFCSKSTETNHLVLKTIIISLTDQESWREIRAGGLEIIEDSRKYLIVFPAEEKMRSEWVHDKGIHKILRQNDTDYQANNMKKHRAHWRFKSGNQKARKKCWQRMPYIIRIQTYYEYEIRNFKKNHVIVCVFSVWKSFAFFSLLNFC